MPCVAPQFFQQLADLRDARLNAGAVSQERIVHLIGNFLGLGVVGKLIALESLILLI